MTPQQAKTLTFLKTYSAARRGVMPSYDEIAAHIGIRSKSGVSRIVWRLADLGKIRLTSGARSIKIIDVDAATVERERCAKIADDYAEKHSEDVVCSVVATEIANAIRGKS